MENSNVEKRLQVNGLPIEGSFDEISTNDFSESGEEFILEPSEDEIYELLGVKMFFDNKIDYKPIEIKFIDFNDQESVVTYGKLKDWFSKSNEGVSVDQDSFNNKKIVCYTRTFTEPVFLVSESLSAFVLDKSINVPAIKKIIINVQSNEKLLSLDGEDLEIVKGRYDLIRYKATNQEKEDWLK